MPEVRSQRSKGRGSLPPTAHHVAPLRGQVATWLPTWQPTVYHVAPLRGKWPLGFRRGSPRSTTSPRCGASGHLVADVASASAFTLVELMVVVAIISILLMLLIPNIRTMREKARSSQCQNNLRQYGIAMNQYMADYSGYFIYKGFRCRGGAICSRWRCNYK